MSKTVAAVGPAWLPRVLRGVGRSLWRALRSVGKGVLVFIVSVLIGDVIAGTLVGPSLLAGPKVGVPVTIVLIVLEGLLVRRIVWARTPPEVRRRVITRKLAKRRTLAGKLDSFGWSGLTYRNALPDMGLIGLLIGACLAGQWLVIASNVQPSLKTWPPLQVYAVMAAITLVGAVLTVVYAVHLYGRVAGLLSWPLLIFLNRSIAALTAARDASPACTDGPEAGEEGGAVSDDHWAADDSDGGDCGGFGGDSGDAG